MALPTTLARRKRLALPGRRAARMGARTILPLLALLAGAPAALGQSTAFSYQGELTQGGQPASGLYDLRFRLYDAATAAQVGSQVCLDNVTVTGGRFTALLDFGAQFAGTAARVLEVDVRQDTGLTCSNATGFTTLSPRQAINPVPRATAASAANALATPAGATAVSVNASGQVGIGTTAPVAPLDVRSGTGSYVRVDAANGDLRVNGGADGFFGLYNEGAAAGRTEFISSVNGVNLSINNSNGNVGIGTAPTGNKLQVNGAIGIPATVRWKSIHGSALAPQHLDSASFGTQGGLGIIDSLGTANSGTVGDVGSSGAGIYFAPIDLPDGCTVTDICVDARDTHATREVVATFQKVNLNTGLVTEVAATFTSGSGNFIQRACHGTFAEPVDNANNVYCLRVQMSTSGTSIHWLLAVRVQYTVTSPLP